MSIWGHRVSLKLIGIVVLLVALGGWVAARTLTPDREIVLVARGMAFFQLGDPATPNPTITLKAGERVRIVLRNEDRGLTHDFAVPHVDAALDPLDWNEAASVTFTVPETPGRYQYVCRPHMLMMRGQILVQ